MLRPVPPVDVLPLLEEERSELVSLLRTLDPQEASTPTACEGWSVRDVAAHLLQDDIWFLSRIRDEHDDPSRDAPPPDFEGLVAWLDKRNQDWVDVSRFMSVETIADLLEATGRITNDYMSSVDRKEQGETVTWGGAGPHPRWLGWAREFTERWVHQQHIRDALDKPGLNGPQFVSPLLQTFMRAVPPAYGSVDADPGTVVAIVVEGRAGGNWALRRDEDGWNLYEGREKETAAGVTTDQDTMWRYLARVIRRKEAEPSIAVEGDKVLGSHLLDAVAAMVAAD
jgi:uncharacterized protein (TIGR03083 family)